MPFRPANLVHTDEAALAESTSSLVETGSPEPGESSSAEEHHVHTVGVVGSNPSSRTIRRPPGHRGEKANYVYFVQAERLQLVKIGIARCMTSRLSGLQTGSPDKLILLGVIEPKGCKPYVLEQRLHERFWQDRQHGEWFNPAPRLMAYIARYAVSMAEVQRRDAEAAMAKLEAHQAKLWTSSAKVRPQAAAVMLPKGSSRKARMERYLLARGLAA